jgi:hypothetical protein
MAHLEAERDDINRNCRGINISGLSPKAVKLIITTNHIGIRGKLEIDLYRRRQYRTFDLLEFCIIDEHARHHMYGIGRGPSWLSSSSRGWEKYQYKHSSTNY